MKKKKVKKDIEIEETPRAKKKKRKKKQARGNFFLLVLFFAIVIGVPYFYKHMFIDVGKELIQYGNIKDTYKTEVVVFRTEYTVPIPANTKISLKAKEGDRVPFGNRIAELEKGAGFDKDLSIRINEITDQIESLKKIGSKGGLFSDELSTLNDEIGADIISLRQMSNGGSLQESQDIVKDMSAKIYRQSLIKGKDGRALNIDELTNEKKAMESLYQNSTDAVFATKSGMVAYNLDGFEMILTPENGMKLTTGRLQELSAQLKKAGYEKGKEKLTKGIRVVNNFEWYGAFLLPEAKAAMIKVNEKHSIILEDGKELKSYISYISPPDKGFCAVFARINDTSNDFWKERLMNGDFVVKSHDGYVIPTKSIIKKDKVTGIYIVRKGTVRFVPVDVLTWETEKSVVDNIKTEDDSPVVLRNFDEVVTTPERVKEAQFLSDDIQ